MANYRFTYVSTLRVNARDARTAQKAFRQLKKNGRLTPRQITAAEPWGTYHAAPVGVPRVTRIQLYTQPNRRKPKTKIVGPVS